VRVIEDRAASGAELLPATLFQALVNPGALILALGLAGNLGHFDAATVDTAKLARPTHFLNVVEAIIVSFELLRYIYELHD